MADGPFSSYLPEYAKRLGRAHQHFEPSVEDKTRQQHVKELHEEIEKLRKGVMEFRGRIMTLGQSAMVTLGLQYLDVGLKYLDRALVKRLQSQAYAEFYPMVLQIHSLGLEKALEALNARGFGGHGEDMLRSLKDDNILAYSLMRQSREYYDPHIRDNIKEQICVDVFDSLVGLSQFKRTVATMPFIKNQSDVNKICELVDQVCRYIKAGSSSLALRADLAPRPQLRELKLLFESATKNRCITDKKRSEDEDLARITQDGLLITLMAGIAAQSVAFVLPIASTQPDLDTIASMLLLSAIVFAVCGVLSQASAYRRLTSTTALPTAYMKPKYITAIAHKGQAFGVSYTLTVLFTVAGLTCFAWMKLHPAEAAKGYRPPVRIIGVFFTIVCVPASLAVLAFVIRCVWHWYEVYHARSERRRFERYALEAYFEHRDALADLTNRYAIFK